MSISKSFVWSIIACLLLVSLVSADGVLTLTNVKNPSFSQNGSFTIANMGDASISAITFSASPDVLTFVPATILSLADGSSQTVTTLLKNIDSLSFGVNSVTISTGVTGSPTLTQSVSRGFCSNGAKGALEITNIGWSNENGDDDDEWKPLNMISMDVDVEANEDNIDDVWVEIGLLDSDGNNVINDMDFTSDDEEEYKIGNLDDGDEDTASFEFVIPADFDINSGNYKLVVKAYSDDAGQANLCTDIQTSDLDGPGNLYQEIDISSEDDEGKYIAFDNIKIKPSDVTCGDTVTLTADAYNIGEDDEDRVLVHLDSTALKLSATQELRSGIDQGGKKVTTFTFSIPEGLPDKDYTLELSAEYDYRSSDYRQSSDDATTVPLKIFGCTLAPTTPTTPTKVASINAELNGEAQAGKTMTVDATITNVGTTTNSYVISARGFDDWAELQQISDRTLSLSAGESADVTLTFLVNKDATGEKSFALEARSGDKTEQRTVSVDIAKASTSTTSLFGGNSNGLVWIIALINVVLIILIILVAVRIARK